MRPFCWRCPNLVKVILLATALEGPQLQAAGDKPVAHFVYGDRPGLKEGFKRAWGFDVVLDVAGRRLIFNVGADPSILKNNLALAGIRPESIDAIVISHHHWEMYEGLAAILDTKPEVPIYTTEMTGGLIEKMNPDWVKQLKVVKAPVELYPGLVLMNLRSKPRRGGPFGIDEVHMVLKTVEGMVIFQGCGHPEIVNIARKSQKLTGLPPYLIMGGTRLQLKAQATQRPGRKHAFYSPAAYHSSLPYIEGIAAALKKMGLKKLMPTHCSGEDAERIFKSHFKEGFIDHKLGMKMELPAVQKP
ncbi:MAG: MBL fold metallo-hydrolase [Planctomycetota bacterium]|nr:MBL fold metallo-hydrolase [Planctomycetota bacterium]